jgi:PKD repeat protein
MKAFYARGKLRAGCYNRAIWEADLAEPSRPVARVAADRLSGLVGEQFSFRSTSVLDEQGAIQFGWVFPGGTPSTSGQRNPDVVYSAPGSYDVQLTVTDATAGRDTVVVAGMIDVQ